MHKLVLLCALLTGAATIFVVDLVLERGVAMGVGYVGVVALAYFTGSVRQTQWIAAGCAGLAVLGLTLSPSGGEIWKILVNRTLALAAVGVTTWFVTRTLLAEARQRAHEVELEELVTERTANLTRRSAELEQANAALEESNLELRQFAYVASHDLQTPLRSITGFLQLLTARYAERLDEEARDWIRRALESATRLKMLIDDLLTYSHVDNHGHTVTSVDLNEVLDAVREVLAEPIRSLQASVSADMLPTVTGDRMLLEELLRNLIDNALKYHSDQPPRIHVQAQPDDDGYWRVAVEDNGIGIAEAQRERIFEMFRRLHNKRDLAGSGIGLALSRRVVQRHGGRIWVETPSEVGSRFCFTLPRTDSP